MSRVLHKPKESSFDEYIFCSGCGDYVYEYCSIHGPLLVVPDDKVGTPTGFPPSVPRAALTLPRAFLHLAPSAAGAGIGVFSSVALPCDVRFGPYRGVKRLHAHSYSGQILNQQVAPTHAPAAPARRANWLRYVRCARAAHNLVAFQYRGHTYYRTTRVIPRFTELLLFCVSECAPAQYAHPHHPSTCSLTGFKTPNDPEKSIFNEPTDEVKLDEERKDNLNGADINSVEAGLNLTRNDCYICNDCGRSFQEKTLLISHIAVHKTLKESITIYNNLRWPCASCNQKFATKSGLINHEIELHDSKKKYKACNLCNYKTSDSYNLKRHVITHSEKKLYTCFICDTKVTTRDSLRRHLNIHIGKEPYQCKICNNTFDNIILLNDHIPTHTEQYSASNLKTVTEEKLYTCFICYTKVSSRDSLRRHLKIHIGKEPCLCKICNNTFDNIILLNDHIPTHTEQYSASNLKTVTEEKLYTCFICYTKVSSRDSLRRHLKIHIGKEPCLCKICNNTFDNIILLNDHIPTHTEQYSASNLKTVTEEKLYTCFICYTKVSSRDSLRRHLKIHIGKEPCLCKICNNTFDNIILLNDHIPTHTEQYSASNLKTVTEDKLYSCAVCNHNLSSSSSLKIHSRVHSRVKPYQCTICNATYRHGSSLTIHTRIHTGIRPYECNVCGLTFTSSTTLNRHVKKH